MRHPPGANKTLHTMYSILYTNTIYYIIYTIYYILYTIHYIPYTVYYVLYNIYYILYQLRPGGQTETSEDPDVPRRTLARMWGRL